MSRSQNCDKAKAASQSSVSADTEHRCIDIAKMTWGKNGLDWKMRSFFQLCQINKRMRE